MEPDTRGQKLLEIIIHGLASYANRNTQTQLGNREKYIGMSDIGGSMTSRIELACAACYSVALALAAIPGISVGVSAFPADYEEDVTATVSPLLRHGERVVNSFGVEAHGSTPMTEAMWWVLGMLSTRPEHRKVILVVTDGYPDDPETAKETIAAAQQMGMEVLGIGINEPIISSIIPVSETITDIYELAPAMFRLLQHTMTEKGR